MEYNQKWRARFFSLAETISLWSEDTSTKVGAVIVVGTDIKSLGWNGLPRGVASTDNRNVAPFKYSFYEHAERNCIYNLIRNNIHIKDASIFTTHFPCPDCSRAIIQIGIKNVYFKKYVDSYKESNAASKQMLKEAGIKFICEYV